MSGITNQTPTDDCFTCKIVQEYVDLANRFTQDLSEALLGPMWALFLSLAALWVVIQGLRLVFHQTSLGEVAKEFMFVMVAGFLLSGQGPELVNNIYTVSLATMSGAASVALQVGSQTDVAVAAGSDGTIPLNEGMDALVRAAEEGVSGVFWIAGQIASSVSFPDYMPVLYALVLVVPYFLVLVVYFAQVVVAVFRIMMLATLSPFLMLGFGFGWGRDMAKSGVRTLIAAFMVLFGATAALAVMLYGVQALNIGDLPEEEIRKLASIDNPEFLLAVAMGIMGTAFMTEATGMANSIANSSLTNTAASVIAGGAGAAALALTNNPVSKFLGGSAADMAMGAGNIVAHKGAHLTGVGIAAALNNPAGEHISGSVANLVSKAKNFSGHMKKYTG